MAWTGFLDNGYLPHVKSSEATNTIAQNAVVCLDTTTEGGVVRPDSANAGKVAGVNESSGTTSGGVQNAAVQPGNSMRVAARRVAKVVVTNGITVAIGDSLYVTSSSVGTVTNSSGGNKFVGTALQAVVGDGVSIISALINALGGV